MKKFSRNLKAKHGFTLAEVLVTLGIIGVVSAMTVPSLMKNHQRQVYVTQLHKVYNEFSQALELYVSDQRAVNLRETRLYNNAAGLRNFVQNYLKVTKDCQTSYTPCFAEEYQKINGGDNVSLKNSQCNFSFTLPSGAAICADTAAMEDVKVDDDNTISSSFTGDGSMLMSLEVDINGIQGPNVLGRDFFYIAVDKDGNFFDTDYNKDTFNTTTGFFGKIVDDGWKMDY